MGAGANGTVGLQNVGLATRLASLSITDHSGLITLNGSLLQTTGVTTFAGPIQVTADTVLDVGSLDWSTSDVFSDTNGPWDVDINAATGPVRLCTFSNNGGSGRYVNNVMVSTGGDYLELNGTVALDYDDVHHHEPGQLRGGWRQHQHFRAGIGVVAIDTEQGNDQNAGPVSLGTGSISADNTAVHADAQHIAVRADGGCRFHPHGR